jgi:uncharacterized damage-inducible protein DinB
MNRNYLIQIANFNNWADNKVMEWLQQINDEQWMQVIVSSFCSIRQTTIHVVSAEKYWVDHWENTPEPTFLSTQFKGTKEELIEIWNKSSADIKTIVNGFPEENYSQAISFKYPGNGRTGQMPFWQTVAHVINHTTYHRGQLITLLRQAGFLNLSSLDMATYFQLNR